MSQNTQATTPLRKSDEGCPHDPKYRFQIGSHEACTICSFNRFKKLEERHSVNLQRYENLFPMMDIASPPGTKVMLWHPHWGFDGDINTITNAGLKFAEVYTVKVTHIGDSLTRVELREVPGTRFNSVHFVVPPATAIEAARYKDALQKALYCAEWYEWDKVSDQDCMEYKTWKAISDALKPNETKS